MVREEHKFTLKRLHKTNLGKCLIAVLCVHLFLLFFHFQEQIKTATYSTIESSITQLKTVVKLISYKKPIKRVKKKKRIVKKSKKILAPTPEKIKEIEKKEVTPIKEDVAKQQLVAKGIATAKARYQSIIRELVNENRYYPRISRRLGQTGKVIVYVKISNTGVITQLEIKNPSQHKYLNKGALKTIRNIGKFPPFPKDLALSHWEGTIPINYNLK